MCITRGQRSTEQPDHVGFVGCGKDFETYSKGNENPSEGFREMGILAC